MKIRKQIKKHWGRFSFSINMYPSTFFAMVASDGPSHLSCDMYGGSIEAAKHRSGYLIDVRIK